MSKSLPSIQHAVFVIKVKQIVLFREVLVVYCKDSMTVLKHVQLTTS